MFAVILFIVAAAVIANFWKMVRATRGMKGPMPLPIIGNSLQLLGNTGGKE